MTGNVLKSKKANKGLARTPAKVPSQALASWEVGTRLNKYIFRMSN